MKSFYYLVLIVFSLTSCSTSPSESSSNNVDYQTLAAQILATNTIEPKINTPEKTLPQTSINTPLPSVSSAATTYSPTSIPTSGTMELLPIYLPQNLLHNEGTLVEDFENLGDWTFDVGVATADTTNYKTGAQPIQMTSSAGETVSMAKTTDFTLPAWTVGRFYIYIPDLTKYYTIRIYLYNSAGNYFTKHWAADGDASWGELPVAGWNLFQFIKDDFSTTGSPDWTSTFTKIQINFTTATGETGTASVDSLYFGVEADSAVLLTFEDGRFSNYNAYRYMDNFQMVGTTYIVANRVGFPGYLTKAQLSEMNSNGWDIANATYHHIDLTTLTDEQVIAEWTDCTDYLDKLGLTRASLHGAIPYVGFSDQIGIDTVAAGILTVSDAAGINRYLNLPVQNWILFPKYKGMLNKNVSLDDAKAKVDNAIARHTIATFVIDGLLDEADETNWATSDFYELIEYIASLELRTLTITELYALQSSSIYINHK